MANFSYVIADKETNECIIVDPSWDLEEILSVIKKNDLKPVWIVNTHSHFDHVLGNEQMAKITGAKILQHKDSPLDKDREVTDGDSIRVGGLSLRVLHTPGHSPDSICLILDGKFVVTGDTLFVGNCGRTDLPGSNPKDMYSSLFDRVGRLDESLVVYPGHNYGQTPTSTIGDEKKTNLVLRPMTEQEFVSFMSHGD